MIHSDGAGTKSVGLPVVSGDRRPTASCGIAQDSIVMNLDDRHAWELGSSRAIQHGQQECPKLSRRSLGRPDRRDRSFPANLGRQRDQHKSGGGETADVGDLTGTVAVDSCAVAVCPRDKVIDNARIGPGLTSSAFLPADKPAMKLLRTVVIGSNGLTSATRTSLFSLPDKYPETFDPQTDPDYVYCGPHRMRTLCPDRSSRSAKRCSVPPGPIFPSSRIIEGLDRKFLAWSLLGRRADQMPALWHPGSSRKTTFSPSRPFSGNPAGLAHEREEMHQVYNMGHRLEVFCLPRSHPRSSNCPKNSTSTPKSLEEPKRPKRQWANHLTILRDGLTLRYG